MARVPFMSLSRFLGPCSQRLLTGLLAPLWLLVNLLLLWAGSWLVHRLRKRATVHPAEDGQQLSLGSSAWWAYPLSCWLALQAPRRLTTRRSCAR
jgi:hypothetical protein